MKKTFKEKKTFFPNYNFSIWLRFFPLKKKEKEIQFIFSGFTVQLFCRKQNWKLGIEWKIKSNLNCLRGVLGVYRLILLESFQCCWLFVWSKRSVSMSLWLGFCFFMKTIISPPFLLCTDTLTHTYTLSFKCWLVDLLIKL